MFSAQAAISKECFTPTEPEEGKLQQAKDSTTVLKRCLVMASDKATREKHYPGSTLRDAITMYVLDYVEGEADVDRKAGVLSRFKILHLHALHYDWRTANFFLQDGLHGLESTDEVIVAKNKYDARVKAEKQELRQDKKDELLERALERVSTPSKRQSNKSTPATPVGHRTRAGKAKKQDADNSADVPPLPLVSESKE
jgi:hypothetical protein